MAVDLVHNVPVIGFKAFCRVVGKPAFGLPVDGDAVVIVEANQLAEPQRARQEQTSWEIPSIRQPSPINT